MHTIGMKTLCLFLLVACAAEKKNLVTLDPRDEKILALEEQLTEQKQQMQSIRERLAQWEKERTISNRPTTPIPTQKLLPPAESEFESLTEAVEGEKIADSSQAPLHPYFLGLEQMREKKYEAALESFRTFLSQNPTHVYADRAQYLISEIHFLSKEYALNIVATNLLISRYPHSVKIPEAMYYRAVSYSEMNQGEFAKSALTDILKKFPTDPVAEKASKRLAELNVKAVPLIEDTDEKIN